jgi:ribosome biogenesis GTPase / thiamine phosphate phosphatase
MSEQERLAVLGWGEDFAAQITAKERAKGLVPARIVEAFRKSFLVHDGEQVLDVATRAALYHQSGDKLDLPAVGDWALVAPGPTGGQGKLWRILTRRSVVVRQAAGKRILPQPIAANIDTIFIVTSLNQEFSRRRLERYLALVREGGASPVIVLSKADLVESVDPYMEEAEAAGNGAPILVVSSTTPEAVNAVLLPRCVSGHTVAFLGSSGVGKSTLVNILMGQALQSTAGIRERDGKGRHTTTTRQLVLLPDGGLVLDTPGMREIQPWQAEEGLEVAFADLFVLGERCKFRDCVHDQEVGCAVKQAVEDGLLPLDRLLSWHKLRLELADAEGARRER